MRKKIFVAIALCLSFAAAHVIHAQPKTAASASQVKQVTPSDSSQILADMIVNSEVPVLVDFWAGWCMPCRFLDPVLAEVANDYKGKILFLKIDIDKHRGIASYFKVNSIPMVYIIEDKTVRTVVRGVQSKTAYVEAVEGALKLAAERKSAPPPTTKQPAEICKNC